METFLVFVTVGHVLFSSTSEAFYQPQTFSGIPTYTPTTLEEVSKFLCQTKKGDKCSDDSPAKIIINKVFDFTESEGTKTETGCYHTTKPRQCLKIGQLKLNVVEQCKGLTAKTVSYNVAGRRGIDVGSNKIIVGENGGGLKGRGLRLYKSENVEIRNLSITDINPQVIWGGDAIDLINVNNVLIDGNYIKNIGRQMIVTHFGSNTGLTISNNVFDGNTPYSATCNGAHYWLWLFLGTGDQISMQNNVILNTSGRGPHLVAAQNSKTLLHMIQNTFYDIKGSGLVDLGDSQSSILLEGNVFVRVAAIVKTNKGNVFMPQNENDCSACESLLGRKCLLNTVVKSRGNKPKNSAQVLQDFQQFKDILAKPIIMKDKITTLISIPSDVKKYIS